MPFTNFIRLRTQIEGLHRWPGAADPDGYLSSPHRHLFVAELDVEVHHDDREIEINGLARWLTALLPSFAVTPPVGDQPVDFGDQSCEQLAWRLVDELTRRHGPDRRVRCAVLEDGILGGGVDWTPETVSAVQ